MPRAWPELNERQLQVLRWIADGCPDGTFEGTVYKNTAIALQNRHLIQISRKGGNWRAEPTTAGRHYLEHGHYPDSEPADDNNPGGPAPTAPPPHRPKPAARVQEPVQLPHPPVLYTVHDLAGMLHVSPDWIWQKVRDRAFPHLRAGRTSVIFTAVHLDRIIDQHSPIGPS